MSSLSESTTMHLNGKKIGALLHIEEKGNKLHVTRGVLYTSDVPKDYKDKLPSVDIVHHNLDRKSNKFIKTITYKNCNYFTPPKFYNIGGDLEVFNETIFSYESKIVEDK